MKLRRTSSVAVCALLVGAVAATLSLIVRMSKLPLPDWYSPEGAGMAATDGQAVHFCLLEPAMAPNARGMLKHRSYALLTPEQARPFVLRLRCVPPFESPVLLRYTQGVRVADDRRLWTLPLLLRRSVCEATLLPLDSTAYEEQESMPGTGTLLLTEALPKEGERVRPFLVRAIQNPTASPAHRMAYLSVEIEDNVLVLDYCAIGEQEAAQLANVPVMVFLDRPPQGVAIIVSGPRNALKRLRF